MTSAFPILPNVFLNTYMSPFPVIPPFITDANTLPQGIAGIVESFEKRLRVFGFPSYLDEENQISPCTREIFAQIISLLVPQHQKTSIVHGLASKLGISPKEQFEKLVVEQGKKYINDFHLNTNCGEIKIPEYLIPLRIRDLKQRLPQFRGRIPESMMNSEEQFKLLLAEIYIVRNSCFENLQMDFLREIAEGLEMDLDLLKTWVDRYGKPLAKQIELKRTCEYILPKFTFANRPAVQAFAAGHQSRISSANAVSRSINNPAISAHLQRPTMVVHPFFPNANVFTPVSAPFMPPAFVNLQNSMILKRPRMDMPAAFIQQSTMSAFSFNPINNMNSTFPQMTPMMTPYQLPNTNVFSTPSTQGVSFMQNTAQFSQPPPTKRRRNDSFLMRDLLPQNDSQVEVKMEIPDSD